MSDGQVSAVIPPGPGPRLNNHRQLEWPLPLDHLLPVLHELPVRHGRPDHSLLSVGLDLHELFKHAGAQHHCFDEHLTESDTLNTLELTERCSLAKPRIFEPLDHQAHAQVVVTGELQSLEVK